MSSEQIHNERELFAKIAEGNEIAFKELFHLYIPLLYPVIFPIIKLGDATEDVIQETFLKLWIYRDKLPEIETPRAWIFRIAYHQAFTLLRKNANQQKLSKKIASSQKIDFLKNEQEELMSFKALAKQVKEAVNQLPTQQKKVYQLSRDKGLKIEEIAKEMNLSQQTIKNTLVRALKFIRAHVKQSGLLYFLISYILYKNLV